MLTGTKVATFKERLSALCDASPLSDTELAAKLKISKQTLSAWKCGVRSPKEPTIIAIAQYFDVAIDWLMGFDVQMKPNAAGTFPAGALPITRQRVPMLGTIHAGEPTFAESEFESYVEAGAAVRCDFALRVVGDSMINARILDGDIVFIRRQDTVADGEIAAVLIDDETTLKRVRFLPGGMLMLQPENPKYQPIIVGGENETRTIRILGKAVAFQSDVR